MQEQVQALQNQIMEVGGDELRRQNMRVKDLREQVTTAADTIARTEL